MPEVDEPDDYKQPKTNDHHADHNSCSLHVIRARTVRIDHGGNEGLEIGYNTLGDQRQNSLVVIVGIEKIRVDVKIEGIKQIQEGLTSVDVEDVLVERIEST